MNTDDEQEGQQWESHLYQGPLSPKNNPHMSQDESRQNNLSKCIINRRKYKPTWNLIQTF